MTTETPDATFHRSADFDAAAPTLIEGLPGHGLVASIAVDQITDQLGLEQYGAIRSDTLPPVASFTIGLVDHPAIDDTTLHSRSIQQKLITLPSSCHRSTRGRTPLLH